MKRLIYIIIFIMYFIFFSKITLGCLEKKDSNNSILNIDEKYYTSFFEKNFFDIFIGIPKDILRETNNLKYRICIYTQHSLNNGNFFFIKNTVHREYYKEIYFKNIIAAGYGFNIFNGPVYFFCYKCSPSIYYLKTNNRQFISKILIYNCGMYSYQLINNIYYSHHLITWTNFNHIITKFENSLNIFLKNNTISFKLSYNVVLNENKFYDVFPNINKYISLSFLYFL